MRVKRIVLIVTVLVAVTGIGAAILSTNSSGKKKGTSVSPVSAASVDLVSLKPVGTPTAEEKRAVFEEVWGLFETEYPSFDFKVVNWEHEKTVYEPKALASRTWPQFFDVLRSMIWTLRDPHSALMNAPTAEHYGPAIFMKYVGNQLVVIAAPDSKRIRPGMVILGINGQSLNHIMDEPSLFRDFFRPMNGQLNQTFFEGSNIPEKVTAYDPKSGQMMSDTLPVYAAGAQYEIWDRFNQRYPMVPKVFSNESDFTIRQLGDGVLYMKISSMSPNLQQEFESNMNLFERAKGLIIDLRDNGGGNSAPGDWFVSHLYSSTTAALEHRFSNGQAWTPDVIDPEFPHLALPTAVLMNGGDASSAEIFIAELAAAPNVATFGSRTSGEDGNPKTYRVMDGVSVRISSWQERMISTGLPIEQFGIPPEHEVEESYNDFLKELSTAYQGKNPMQYDDVFQAGLSWVQARIRNSN